MVGTAGCHDVQVDLRFEFLEEVNLGAELLSGTGVSGGGGGGWTALKDGGGGGGA